MTITKTSRTIAQSLLHRKVTAEKCEAAGGEIVKRREWWIFYRFADGSQLALQGSREKSRRLFAMTGPELRAIRNLLGWTQAHLAEELGMHPTTIIKWETGARPIPKMGELAVQALAYHNALRVSGHFKTFLAQVSDHPLS